MNYYGNEPYSYSGKNTVYNYFNKDDVNKALEKSDIYTRFKQHRKPKKYSPIYVYRKRELFQSDVVFFTNKEMVQANDGYRYLFTTIDVFTKMAWVYPLKSNTCQNVMNCFIDILEKCGEKPERLNTDRGSEMICEKFERYLKNQNIHHYLAYSLRKCPVVERFNLTIQTLLYKMMAKHNSLKWTEFLDDAMKIYLNRKHRTIGMSPIEGDRDKNERKIRKVYFKKYMTSNLKKTKPKFKVGDSVRIFAERGQFHRGYMEDFTREHFTITKVSTNLPFPRYRIKEYSGGEIIGSFFEDELVKYEPVQDNLYDIEVIKERRRKGVKEVLVHYVGWPKSYDEWKPARDIYHYDS